MPTALTLIDKIWRDHRVAEVDARHSLLHIDRIFLHERTGPALLAGLAGAGRQPRHPQRVFGCMDHIVDTTPQRSDHTQLACGQRFVTGFRQRTQDAGIRLFDLHDAQQGIVQVVSSEQGIA